MYFFISLKPCDRKSYIIILHVQAQKKNIFAQTEELEDDE